MVNKNIYNPLYFEGESTTCEICCSVQIIKLEIRLGLSYFICGNCNHASQMISKLQIEDLFKSSQEKYFGENSSLNLVAESILDRERTSHRKVVFNRFISEKIKVLEVGPGAGSFLRWMCGKGHNVTAIEDSNFLAKELTLIPRSEIIMGNFEDCKLPHNSFDLFCSFHVIEHALDSRIHLELAFKFVREGGLAFIATPNGNSWQQRLFPRLSPNFDSAHLRVFSQKSLRLLAEDIGWIVINDSTPEYSSAWLRVLSKVLRKLKGEDEETTAGKYQINHSLGSKILLYFYILLSFPFRLLQRQLNGGNENFIVLKRPI
jgi:2-polyprenyl-3-methyl-5-hydroxy-6-metoxy-1,4-benzoquinol methylase